MASERLRVRVVSFEEASEQMDLIVQFLKGFGAKVSSSEPVSKDSLSIE